MIAYIYLHSDHVFKYELKLTVIVGTMQFIIKSFQTLTTKTPYIEMTIRTRKPYICPKSSRLFCGSRLHYAKNPRKRIGFKLFWHGPLKEMSASANGINQ
jgi:hypothetical protein